MPINDAGLRKAFTRITHGDSTKKLTKADAQVLIDAASDGRGLSKTERKDLIGILDGYAGGTTAGAAELISDFLQSGTSSKPKSTTTSPLGARLHGMTKQIELDDLSPAHHQGFADALHDLSQDTAELTASLGINSLSTLVFVFQFRKNLTDEQCSAVEQLHQKCCLCACHHVDQQTPVGQKPLRTPKVDVAGYGEFVRPQRPAGGRDPLFIGMNDVAAGATIEIRNRSEGISESHTMPWISLPVDTTKVRSDDGRLQLAIGPDALRHLELDAWDQFEIRQRHPDGRVSEPVMPDLGTERANYQLPSDWRDQPVQDVGQVTRPAGARFRPFFDSAIVELDPKDLDQCFTPKANGEGMFTVSAEVPKGEPFASFVEPRAQIYLKNLRTGEVSDPIQVKEDGTFEAKITGEAKDAFVMHVYDQGRGQDDLAHHRILTFSSSADRPLVSYAPHRGQPEPTDLIMETLTAKRGLLEVDCGITPGAVVTVTDLESNEATKLIADQNGSLKVPAEVTRGKIFEIQIENPFSHEHRQLAQERGQNYRPRPGEVRVVRVQVGSRYALSPVATDAYPPSTTTGHVKPGELGERMFDPNTEVTFVPTKMGYSKDSRGSRTGGMVFQLEPDRELVGDGSVNVRSLVQTLDGGTVQMVIEPHLQNAIGMPEGEGESFSSTLGGRFGPRADVRFGANNFLDGFREHIDVELLRPDGTLIGTAKMKPDDVTGGHIQSWDFSDFAAAKDGTTVARINMQGIRDGEVPAPPLRASAFIKPNHSFGDAEKLTPEQLRDFQDGSIPGKLQLDLSLSPGRFYKLEDIAALEVVNLTEHPGGFDEPDAIETAKIETTEDGQNALASLSQAATNRLDVHLGDRLVYRARLHDGSTTLLSNPTKVDTPAKKKRLTRRGDFISAGVTTRWEQIHIGDSYAGTARDIEGGKLVSKNMVMGSPPQRDPNAWADCVHFDKGDDGMVTMRFEAGSTPADGNFRLSNYALTSPYGTDSLYATTSSQLRLPAPGSRPQVRFGDIPDGQVMFISLGNRRVVYPPSAKSNPKVKKFLEANG